MKGRDREEVADREEGSDLEHHQMLYMSEARMLYFYYYVV